MELQKLLIVKFLKTKNVVYKIEYGNVCFPVLGSKMAIVPDRSWLRRLIYGEVPKVSRNSPKKKKSRPTFLTSDFFRWFQISEFLEFHRHAKKPNFFFFKMSAEIFLKFRLLELVCFCEGRNDHISKGAFSCPWRRGPFDPKYFLSITRRVYLLVSICI